jgi:hypothetical protein
MYEYVGDIRNFGRADLLQIANSDPCFVNKWTKIDTNHALNFVTFQSYKINTRLEHTENRKDDNCCD